jgi:hypothetical protein
MKPIAYSSLWHMHSLYCRASWKMTRLMVRTVNTAMHSAPYTHSTCHATLPAAPASTCNCGRPWHIIEQIMPPFTVKKIHAASLVAVIVVAKHGILTECSAGKGG